MIKEPWLVVTEVAAKLTRKKESGLGAGFGTALAAIWRERGH